MTKELNRDWATTSMLCKKDPKTPAYILGAMERTVQQYLNNCASDNWNTKRCTSIIDWFWAKYDDLIQGLVCPFKWVPTNVERLLYQLQFQ